MVNSKVVRCFLITAILLGLPSDKLGYTMSQMPTKPVTMEFVHTVYDKDARAVIIELVVPDIATINKLSRIELLIVNSRNEATFAVMLNHGDRNDPIPPGNFGVIKDPASDDRSIKNVSSAAGIPGRWDHPSPHGTLLKQSVSGVINGNLGVSLWISPRDWDVGHYTIKTRAVQWKHLPSPWQKLTEFHYTGDEVKDAIQNRCLVKPTFINVSDQAVIPFKHIGSITLLRHERQQQKKGVTIKRWAGDTASQYKYIEKEKRKLNTLQGGHILLEPGIYQLKHNSVLGSPPSGFYGASDLFEIKPGEKSLDVVIRTFPAI